MSFFARLPYIMGDMSTCQTRIYRRLAQPMNVHANADNNEQKGMRCLPFI